MLRIQVLRVPHADVLSIHEQVVRSVARRSHPGREGAGPGDWSDWGL